MNATPALALPPLKLSPRHFQSHHRWDPYFVSLSILAIWVGIGSGFGPEIVDHVSHDKPPYPLIVHVHAAAFVGWLVLLTSQALLIRTRRVAIHRKLGVAGALLAVAMVVLGPATALIVQHRGLGTPDSDPAFLSVQLSDIVAFAGLAFAGLALRKRAAAHKRLILLATLYISDAGFSRWLAGPISHHLGEGFWATGAAIYGANDILILAMGVYDLVTRRRLHLAYVVGIACILSIQFTALSLYFSPAWKPWALRLIGP